MLPMAEFVHGYETEAGYTIVRVTGGRWEFAARDGAGRLRPTDRFEFK